MRKRKAETVLSDTVGYYHRSKLCCLGIVTTNTLQLHYKSVLYIVCGCVDVLQIPVEDGHRNRHVRRWFKQNRTSKSITKLFDLFSLSSVQIISVCLKDNLPFWQMSMDTNWWSVVHQEHATELYTNLNYRPKYFV